MADSPILPGSHQWRLVPSLRGGPPDLPPEFFRFFRELVAYVAQTQGNSASLAEVIERLDALEAASANAITGQHSVQVTEEAAETLIRLVGDLAVPGVSRYYGTNASGARGWYERLLSTMADVDLSVLPADFDSLTYDSASGKWIPRAVGGSPNLDGGHADSTYGAVAPMDGGGA